MHECPTSRRFRIRLTSTSNFPQKNSSEEKPSRDRDVKINKTRSPTNGPIILASASVFANDAGEKERSEQKNEKNEIGDIDEDKDKIVSDEGKSDQSGEDEQKTLTSVEELIQEAIAIHPKIQSARSRIAAAQFRIPQARALPDPMAETLFWPIANNAQQLASGRMTNQLSLSQTVPWPEKLRARSRSRHQRSRNGSS